ncbi:MAG: right-handed parallel beta-helix repeat-containing protein, partial [Holophaga sp.]|nr:right-handed parallel beta-helix repeat-containing protein [Holophaga sp.]
EHRIVYEATNDPAGYDRYSIYNALAALDMPGEYVVAPRPAGGTRRVVLWPRSAADMNAGRFTYAARPWAIDLSDKSHLVVEGFEIRSFAGEGLTDGVGIGCVTRAANVKADLVIRNNFIHHNMHATRGYGGVYLSNVQDALVEDNEVRENKAHAGIFGSDIESGLFQNNRVIKAGSTCLKFYTCSNLKVLFNEVREGRGTHSNGMTFYLGCADVLVDGNRVVDSNIALTYQASRNLTFINNLLDGSDRTTYVAASWGDNTGSINFLNNTIVGSSNDVAVYYDTSGDPGATITVKNNILDGHRAMTGGNRTHNLFVGGAQGLVLGAGERLETDLTKVFRNAATGDFRLQIGSPALDVGTDIQAHLPTTAFPGYDFRHDLTQLARPQGSGLDIGAYELNPAQGNPAPILIDHTCVDPTRIPDRWVEAVKQLTVQLVGESHSGQFKEGLVELQQLHPRFAVKIASQTSELAAPGTLNIFNHQRSSANSGWAASTHLGEQHYWSCPDARAMTENTARHFLTLNRPLALSFFQWCTTDMVRDLGPSDNLGVADKSCADTKVIMDAERTQAYLDSLARFNAAFPGTRYIYVTSVMDGETDPPYYTVGSWNAMVVNDAIRSAAQAQGGVLFDSADIENWNTTNTAHRTNTITVNGAQRTVRLRHADYNDATSHNHTNTALRLRKATAIWWMLARIAGWDGVSN